MSTRASDTSVGRNSFRAGGVSVAEIKRAVCDSFDLSLEEMASPRRLKVIVHPRQVAMYLARELTPFSYPRLGHFFNDRHHTTILCAVNSVERRMGKSKALRTKVESLRESLIPAIPHAPVDNSEMLAFVECAAGA